jgi:hypothetical protein
MSKIKQAAFLLKTGEIYLTGSFHDVDCLPEGSEIEEEGYLDDEGHFVTRESATVTLDDPDEELSKKSKDYSISQPAIEGTDLTFHAIHTPTQKVVGVLKLGSKPVNLKGHSHEGYHMIRDAEVSAAHRRKGLYTAMLMAAAGHVKKQGSKGIASEGHWRSEAASKVWDKIASKGKQIQRMRGKEDESDFRMNEDSLSKAKTPFELPGLGMENRRETPIMGTMKPIRAKQELITASHARMNPKYQDPQKYTELRDRVQGKDKKSLTTGQIAARGSGSNASWAHGGQGSLGYKQHEDMHHIMSRVAQKHGAAGAVHLARNLYNLLDQPHKEHIEAYVNHATAGREHPANVWHEERLTHLLTFLNAPNIRQQFYEKLGMWDPTTNAPNEQGVDFDKQMKQAYRIVQAGAAKATPDWTKRKMVKSEADSVYELMKWEPTDEMHEIAANMINEFHIGMPEFKAAKFMAHGYTPTAEDIEEAMHEFEGDHISTALMAHHIPVNDENVEILKSLASMEEMSKVEMEVAAIPRIVKPYNKEDKEVASMVQDAFKNHEVKAVKLGGKHSKGSALVKDPETEMVWLLKPGSGKLSVAQGIREESVSQSRREVAFNRVANLIGLGRYVPKAALLVLDGEEIAALQFFTGSYKPMEKLRKDPDFQPNHLLHKFVQNGLLYKWATMDYILGQADRHSGNIMIDDGENIRFIDAGSTFAGPSFNPANDPKSWVPYYLRVFTPHKFNKLTANEKFSAMPPLTGEADDALKSWIDSFNTKEIVQTLNLFQINPQPVLDRIKNLQNYPGTKSEFLRKFYSGGFRSNV